MADEEDTKKNRRSSDYYYISPTPVLTIEPHREGVWDVRELRDGTVATSSFDMTLKVWSLFTGECLFVYRHTLPICRFLELSEGRYFAIGDISGCVTTVNRRTGTTAITEVGMHHRESINSMVELYDDMFASGSSDQSIKIWKKGTQRQLQKSGERKREHHRHKKRGGEVEEDVVGWQCVQTIEHAHFDVVMALCCSTVDGSLISGSRDRAIKIWIQTNRNTASTKPLFELKSTLELKSPGWIEQLFELQSSGVIVIGDGMVRWWNRDTSCVQSTKSYCSPSIATAYDNDVVLMLADGILHVFDNNDTNMDATKVVSPSTTIRINEYQTDRRMMMLVLSDGRLLYGAGIHKKLHVRETWMRYLLD